MWRRRKSCRSISSRSGRRRFDGEENLLGLSPVVLIDAALHREPIDDPPDQAAAKSDELEDAQPDVVEVEAIHAKLADQNRQDQSGRPILFLGVVSAT